MDVARPSRVGSRRGVPRAHSSRRFGRSYTRFHVTLIRVLRRLRALLPLLCAPPLLLAGGHAARAQTSDPECPRGRITEIFVDNKSVFEVGSPDLDARFNWAYRAVNRLHVRTRRSVIRRALLVREGACLDPALLADSERTLRATPYIASADVYAVPQADGTQHVVVETRDEWTFRLEPQFESGDGFELTGLVVREDNLLGTGQRIAGYFLEHQGERIYGADYVNRQTFGTLARLDLGVARTPVGHSLVQGVMYPFRGETGRWAFRQVAEQQEHNFELFVPRDDGGLDRRLFPERRRALEAAGVVRLGRRGNLTMFGAGLAGEWIEYPFEDSGGAAVSEVPGLAGLDTVAAVRLMFLAGQRNVWWERRRGFDAVRADEDVELGAQVEVGVGRSIGALSRGDDLAVNAGFDAARMLGRGVLAGIRVTGEGRRDFAAAAGAPEWNNLFAQADAWAYWRPGDDSRHVFVAAAGGAAGWNTTVPFQLTLGNRAGLRGLPRHSQVGTERVVATLEHRAYLGWPYPRLFDLGSAAFVDAGRAWDRGDRFGPSSASVAVAAGVGLRVAFPPGSRDTYRLDVAFPLLDGGNGRGVRISFGTGQAVGRRAVRNDPQLVRSSRRPVTGSVLGFID
jgi:hypothetical protein